MSKNKSFLIKIFLILNIFFSLVLLFQEIFQVDKFFITLIELVIFIFLFIYHNLKKKINITNISFLKNILLLSFFLLVTFNRYSYEKIEIFGKIKYLKQEELVFSYKKSNYYSNYDFYGIKIKTRNKISSLTKFINEDPSRKKYIIRRFKLLKSKTPIILKVKLNNNEELKYLKTSFDTEYYFYKIDDIIMIENGKEYNFSDKSFPKSFQYFLELTKMDENKNTFHQGKYYNMVSCFINKSKRSQAYIIPIKTNVDTLENFCSKIKNISKNN